VYNPPSRATATPPPRVTNTDALLIKRILLTAFRGALHQMPWTARLAILGPAASITHPPGAEHFYPGPEAWTPVSKGWSSVAIKSNSPPATMDIALFRHLFHQTFRTGGPSDMPPSPKKLREILDHPAARDVLAISDANDRLALAAREATIHSPAGLMDILRISAILLDRLQTDPHLITQHVQKLAREADQSVALNVRLGLDLPQCPASRHARHALALLASDLSGPPPNTEPGSQLPRLPTAEALFARQRTMDAVESCLRWVWRAVGTTSAPFIPPSRGDLSRNPQLADWDQCWAALRHLARNHA
jgi:hypothetical protein